MSERKSRRKHRRLRIAALTVALVSAGVWLNNTSMLASKGDAVPELLAHRGLGQTLDIEGVEWDINTARIIHEPEHQYLENTLDGIVASIHSGADLVEFDVRLTKDKQLAVFHDFLLEYRTDGKGLVSEHGMDELPGA